MTLLTPVSPGEVIDKITILQIKYEKINNKNKLKNIKNELNLLLPLINKKKYETLEIQNLMKNLKKVNHSLWNIEDNIREKEKFKEFDDEFIELARSVYKENDKRAAVKKEINYKYRSIFVEEKNCSKINVWGHRPYIKNIEDFLSYNNFQ